jgi:hypothetical protein
MIWAYHKMKLNYRKVICCGNCYFKNFDSYDGANYCLKEPFITDPNDYGYERRR